MIVVFAAFVLGDQRVIKEIGLGLSAGVLAWTPYFVRNRAGAHADWPCSAGPTGGCRAG